MASAKDVVTKSSGTLNADDPVSYVILNGPSVLAGDFFLSIETPVRWSPKRNCVQAKIVREVGQRKFIRKRLTQAMYDEEREKSAGRDDIFLLYTTTKISDGLKLPDRSGVVDESCWNSYFGPFAGRAYSVAAPRLKK
jgi:hypothetical protein